MSKLPPKKILFISRHAPYGSSLAKDALDAILAASAYEQELSLLFMDDGVFQLLAQQETNGIAQKSFSAIFPALAFYEIDSIYLHKESLEQRQISSVDLAIENTTILDSAAVRHLLDQQDQLLSF